MRAALLLALVIAIFGGCSSKEYFEPQVVHEDEWPIQGYMSAPIVDSTADGAVLEDGKIITKKGLGTLTLPPEYQYVGTSGGWIIASQINGDLLLSSVSDSNQTQLLHLKRTIAAASVKGDVIAVLFVNNDMALYSLASKELLFKEQGNAPIVVDVRIVNPSFLGNLVLFLTLDGKIVIIDSDAKQLLRSMIVSSEEYFNNIIYFNVIKNNMVAATGNQLFVLSGKERRQKYELRDVIYTDKGIWISTKQGEVIKLTPSLQLEAKQKFPFAHFLGMILTDKKIYLLEKEGYLIVLDSDLSAYDIHEIDLDEGYVFVTDKAFYVNDQIISIE